MSDTLTVIFRVDRETKDVYAIYPEDLADFQGHCTAYFPYGGGHGAADYWVCLGTSRPAKPSEYRQLLRDLKRLMPNIKVAKRASWRMHERRRQELQRLRQMDANQQQGKTNDSEPSHRSARASFGCNPKLRSEKRRQQSHHS